MTADRDEARSEGPVIRDRRRIDPVTGELRERQETAAPGSAAPGSAIPGSAALGADDTATEASDTQEISDTQAELAERTADLQRLQAEYLNYKRRVDRDRENARVNAIASALTALLPVLDDVARAREHEGELTGGFKAVADSFEGAVAKLGLTSFGEVGDAFDPRIHEALMHSYADDVDGPTCAMILQVGYSMGERILRPARVAVAEPQPGEGNDAAADAPGGASYDDNGSDDSDGPADPGA